MSMPPTYTSAHADINKESDVTKYFFLNLCILPRMEFKSRDKFTSENGYYNLIKGIFHFPVISKQPFTFDLILSNEKRGIKCSHTAGQTGCHANK